jgi:hypothetical protein
MYSNNNSYSGAFFVEKSAKNHAVPGYITAIGTKYTILLYD